MVSLRKYSVIYKYTPNCVWAIQFGNHYTILEASNDP